MNTTVIIVAILALPWVICAFVMIRIVIRDERELRYYKAHQRRLITHQERAALTRLRPRGGHVEVHPAHPHRRP